MAPWQVTEGGRMRLVALSQPRNGAITALLQIEPKAGWKTYWRNPGGAGMAPELDFSGSTNLRFKSIAFPVPDIGNDAGGLFIGYHEAVSLILELDKPIENAPSAIDLKALVGICEDICVPFPAEFKLKLDPTIPEGEEFTALLAAQAALPEKAAKDFNVYKLERSSDGQSLLADVTLPGSEKVEAAAAASAGVILGKDPTISVNGNLARIEIPIKRIEDDGAPHSVTLMVKSGTRAMETTLALD